MNTNKIYQPSEGELAPNSPRRLARIAGVFYLLVGLVGGFAEGLGDPKLYAAGNGTCSWLA